MEQQQQEAHPAFQGEEQQSTVQQVDHSELTGAVAKLQNELDRRVERVKADRRLDKTEQLMQIRETWDEASEVRARVMEAYEKQLEERSARAEHSLFHVIPANRDSVRQAYNDVYDRTQALRKAGQFEEAREELERLWERAIRTGDRALETAIGQLAIERGEEKLRDAYLARSPEKARAWQRYGEARTKLDHFNDPQQRFFGNIAGGFSLRKPPEA
jgi:tetratricopeptide (TPR) repeat protein